MLSTEARFPEKRLLNSYRCNVFWMLKLILYNFLVCSLTNASEEGVDSPPSGLTPIVVGHRTPQMSATMEHEKRMRREIANSNERRRMQSINAGFQNLRTLIPHHEGEKLSKVSNLYQIRTHKNSGGGIHLTYQYIYNTIVGKMCAEKYLGGGWTTESPLYTCLIYTTPCLTTTCYNRSSASFQTQICLQDAKLETFFSYLYIYCNL